MPEQRNSGELALIDNFDGVFTNADAEQIHGLAFHSRGRPIR